MGTFIVIIILAAIVCAIIADIIKRKKRGQCVGCDCSCAQCPRSGGGQ